VNRRVRVVIVVLVLVVLVVPVEGSDLEHLDVLLSRRRVGQRDGNGEDAPCRKWR